MLASKLLELSQPQIGQLIRNLRQELGLSQRDFAVVIGVGFATVNRWENGHCNPMPIARRVIHHQLEQLGTKGQQLLQQHLC